MHQVFKRKLSDGNKLIFVPSLNFVSIVKKGKQVPNVIESEKTIPQKFHYSSHFIPTGVTFLTTDKCNLQCCYCYGSFKPANFTFLPINIGKRIIDVLVKNALENNMPNINVSYFGGEPTQHWDFLEEVNAYANLKAAEYGLKVNTSISTNGCLAKKQCDWLIENINDIQISMDGFKLIQDRHRDNSFDKCFESAKYLYEHNKYFNIRATVSSFSVNFLEDIIKFFVTNFPHSKIGLEPLSSCGRLSDPEIKSPNVDILFKNLEIVYLKYEKYIKTTLCQFSGSYNDNFCGIDRPNFFVTPNQCIVACSRIVDKGGINLFQYGNISDDGEIVINQSQMEFIRNINANNITKCSNCFAKSVCKGGCPSQKLFLFGQKFNSRPLTRKFCNNICNLTEKRLLHKLNYKLV